jgi:hypothetical protein
MQSSSFKYPCRSIAAAVLTLSALAFGAGGAQAVSQSGEQKDMRRVGHADLQGRAAYHPTFIDYPDGRVIAFIGTHSNTSDNGPRPNPLKAGSPVEPNGTMIVDITNPAKPVEKFHIPGPVPSGAAQTQSNRACLGSDLPGGADGHVYLMRNVQVNSVPAVSGYEVWDVTDVTNPVLVGSLRNLRSTHKHWWECKTGIAYLPGSKNSTYGLPLWRQSQSMMIVDWSNPAAPTILRTHGLPGGQPAPNGSGPVAPSLHGAISAHEHPNASGDLASGVDVIGNRVYAAWGVGDDGVLQILDRTKLLPPPYGMYAGDRDNPTNAELESAQTAILYMSPDQGGHTSFPVFGMKPKSYQLFTSFQTRDIVMLASESTADLCDEAPHWSFVVDVTVENSKNPATGVPIRQNPWQGPMVLSTLSLDPAAGEKWPRGNYCTRGARFGVHSSEENFGNPFYGRLTFLAYFTGGVRVWDIREPHAPVEVAFYVPESNALTEPAGYMTNNLEVDNRGYTIAVDRNGAGMDLLELHGKAKQIGLGP